MAKNMTRKGLALGAAFALVGTGFVAAPAYAADLSLVPSAGTTYNVFLSDSFTLNSAVTGNTNIANTSAWKWEVVNNSDVTVGVSGTYWNGTAYATSGLSTTDTGATKVYAAANATQVIGKVNTITLDPTTTSTSSTFSVTVRAFSDLDGSGSVTSGDLVSDAQTVTFVKGSEVTGSVALDALVAGVAPTATLTFSGNINYSQVTAANITSAFTVNGSAAAGTAALNSDKNGFTLTAAAAASASQIISATGKWKSYDGDTTLVTASSGTSTVSAASAATTATASIANGANVATGSATAPTADVQITKNLRSGTTALSYDIVFKKDATTALSAASPVTVVVTEVGSTLALDEKVTVNGKTLTGTAGSADTVTTYGMTDAAGKFTVSVTAANAKNLDNITIVATSNTGDVAVDLKWVDAALDNVYVTNAPLGNATATVVRGSNVTVNYVVVDQFDQPWTKTDYSYRLEFTNSGTATNPAPLAVSNGAATLSWTENSTAASGAYGLTAALYSQTGNGSWTSESKSAVYNLNVVASATAASAISLGTTTLDSGAAITTTVPLADKVLAALDNRVYDNANAALGVTADKGAKIVATVTSATGANVEGAAVTVSAAGLYFSTTAGGTGVVAKDSIVLNSSSAGTVTVFIYGQSAGDHVVTFTSGSASKTATVSFTAAAAADGTALTIDAPASAQPGSTFKVTGKLVDKYGNPVQIATAGTGANPTLSVAYAGPGLVSGTLPSTTSAAGEFVFYVLLGANDSGSATVTASYDADGTTTTKSAISASKTVLVGTSEANQGALATWTKNLGDGSVKMYAKNVLGQGKVQFKLNGKEIAWTRAASLTDVEGASLRTVGSANYLVRTVDLAKGKNVLEIYVDGYRMKRVVYSY